MELIIVVVESVTSGIGALLGAIGGIFLALLPAAGAHTLADFIFTGYDYDRLAVLFLAVCILVPAIVIIAKWWRELACMGFWVPLVPLALVPGAIGAGVCTCTFWIVGLIGCIESPDIVTFLTFAFLSPLFAIALGIPIMLLTAPVASMVVQVLGACHGLVSPGWAAIRVLEGFVVLRLLVLILLWR